MPEPTQDNPAQERPAVSVIIPAYNEETRIGRTLEAVVAYFDSLGSAYEILVVDDGSSDQTARMVADFSALHPTMHLLQYGGNRGKGAAVRHGMLHSTGHLVLFSDADLATPIEEFAKLRDAILAGNDVAIGSRDIAGANLVRHQSAIREAGGKLFNRLVQMLAVPGIHDTQCGFKLFTAVASRRIFSLGVVENFSFDVEALFLARRLGYSIAEVPITWQHQEGSKVRFVRDALRMLRTLLQIRLHKYDPEVDIAGQRSR